MRVSELADIRFRLHPGSSSLRWEPRLHSRLSLRLTPKVWHLSLLLGKFVRATIQHASKPTPAGPLLGEACAYTATDAVRREARSAGMVMSALVALAIWERRIFRACGAA